MSYRRAPPSGLATLKQQGIADVRGWQGAPRFLPDCMAGVVVYNEMPLQVRMWLIGAYNQPQCTRALAGAAASLQGLLKHQRAPDMARSPVGAQLLGAMRSFWLAAGASAQQWNMLEGALDRSLLRDWIATLARMAVADGRSAPQVNAGRAGYGVAALASMRAAKSIPRFHEPVGGAYDDDDVSGRGACWALLSLIGSIFVFMVNDAAYQGIAERRAEGRGGLLDEWNHVHLAGPGGDPHYRIKLAERGEVDALTLFGAVYDMLDDD